MRPTAGIDSITLEIIWSRLIALVDEAAVALKRMAFSTIVRESNDFCCVLLDARGNSVAQNTKAIPIFIASIGITARRMLERFPPESLRPGDVLITNDPWLATGHLNDFTVITPLFREGRLLALAGSVAHASDIGGRLWSADAREVFEEGLRVPITKLYRAGEPNDLLFEVIRANVRVPDEVTGDLQAQVLANETMGRGLLRLLDEYGLAEADGIFAEVIDRSEGAMQRAIRALPAGTYTHAIMIDGFEKEVRIAIALTVGDGDIRVDYTGTSEQSDRGINSVPNYTFAYTAYALKCALTPLVPNNEGSYRPIRVWAPEGTILNPRFPAAVGARGRTGHFLTFAVFGALAQAVPDRVLADSGGAGFLFLGGYDRRGRKFTHLFPMNGGLGARPAKDGISCLAFPANCSNAPVEVVETLTAIQVNRKELLTDSGGPGRFRGGCGLAIDLEVVRDLPLPEVTVSVMAERAKHPAGGLCGGLPGSRQEGILNGSIPVHPKKQIVVRAGDRLAFRTPGGGGFGDPRNRDPGLVARDVRLGFVSPEAAREHYGVALRPDGSVDPAETERLRSRRGRAEPDRSGGDRA